MNKKNASVEDKPDFFHIVMDFLMKPLEFFREEQTIGDDLFKYLFYNREQDRKDIKLGIESINNVTVIGKPGQGKSSLLHYMFLSLEKDNENIFPIILDWRRILPKQVNVLLAEFVEKIREYFIEIKQPCNSIEERTTVYNSIDHMRLVSNHLQNLNKTVLKKKLVIFIDDLDYAGGRYVEILKEYFFSYTVSDKAVVVLSCRPRLYNNISKDDEIRQCYRSEAKKINLNRIDLESLINFRLRSIAKSNKKKSFQERIINFNRDDNLDVFILKKLKSKGFKQEDLNAIKTLPFNECFYEKLYKICNENLRDIESLLPIFIVYENKKQKPSFNENFIEAYINAIYNFAENKLFKNSSNFLPKDYVLDLVSEKTQHRKGSLNGNSISQNVLEYFFYNKVKDENFFESMAKYGITKEQAEASLKLLVDPPYNLLDPNFVYSLGKAHEINEHYIINDKGQIYVQEILPCEYYFERMNQYLTYKKMQVERVLPSKRSYYKDERLCAK